jgi:hypothetical protein
MMAATQEPAADKPVPPPTSASSPASTGRSQRGLRVVVPVEAVKAQIAQSAAISAAPTTRRGPRLDDVDGPLPCV